MFQKPAESMQLFWHNSPNNPTKLVTKHVSTVHLVYDHSTSIFLASRCLQCSFKHRTALSLAALLCCTFMLQLHYALFHK